LSPASAGFLIRLLFNPENGSDTILRNVPYLSTDYMTFYHRRLFITTAVRTPNLIKLILINAIFWGGSSWQLMSWCRPMIKFFSYVLCLYFFVHSCCSHLEPRASVKNLVSLHFRNLRQSVGLLGRGIGPCLGCSEMLLALQEFFWRETFIELTFFCWCQEETNLYFIFLERNPQKIHYTQLFVCYDIFPFHILWDAHIGCSSQRRRSCSLLWEGPLYRSLLCSCRLLSSLLTSDLFNCLRHYSKAVRRVDVVCGFLVDWHGKQINSAVLTELNVEVMLFWGMTSSSVMDRHVSEEPSASIFRLELVLTWKWTWRITVFWEVKTLSLVERYKRSEGVHCFHLY
jgi:hypothetical protein